MVPNVDAMRKINNAVQIHPEEKRRQPPNNITLNNDTPLSRMFANQLKTYWFKNMQKWYNIISSDKFEVTTC